MTPTPKRDEVEAVALAREAMLQAHAWIKGCIMDGYVGDKTIAKLDAALAAIAALDASRMGKPAGVNQFGMLPCPFCGGEGEPDGWSSTDRSGPACQQCDATADTMELWNSRPGIWTQEDIDEAIKKGDEMAAFFEASDPIDASRARDKGDGWKPIDSAPKDGEWFLAWHECYDSPLRAIWVGHEYQSEEQIGAMNSVGWWSGYPPTHWHPLPAPPTETDDGEVITPAPGMSEAIRAEIETPERLWPSGCSHPGSCERHGRCMYFGCEYAADTNLPAQIATARARLVTPAPGQSEAIRAEVTGEGGGERVSIHHAVINYTNHRGERGERRIRPLEVKFKATEWHPEPQWLLSAFDIGKQELREFAMKDIHSWRPAREAERAP